MKRFFFNLQGAQNTSDPVGLLYSTDLEAFRAAQNLASELFKTRPHLHGNTWVVIARKEADDLYFVGI
jgi:hypothetical protein